MIQISVETPEIQDFIEKQVKAGRFSSAAEVIEAGVARLMLDPVDDELDDADLAAIEESEGQIERGEDLDWKEVSAKLRAKYLGK
jgi:Arc/MetJ-type ribon-helix-helix transcriptional regulator